MWCFFGVEAFPSGFFFESLAFVSDASCEVLRSENACLQPPLYPRCGFWIGCFFESRKVDGKILVGQTLVVVLLYL